MRDGRSSDLHNASCEYQSPSIKIILVRETEKPTPEHPETNSLPHNVRCNCCPSKKRNLIVLLYNCSQETDLDFRSIQEGELTGKN